MDNSDQDAGLGESHDDRRRKANEPLQSAFRAGALDPPDDRQEFQGLVNRLIDEGKVTELDLCEMFAASVPTVRRWRSGESCPQPEMCQFISRKLASL